MSESQIFYEIVGCNPKNLGDLLMLDATISALGESNERFAPALRTPRTLRRSSFAKEIRFLPVLKDGGNRSHQKRYWNERLFRPGSRFLASFSDRFAAFADVKRIVDVCGYKYGGVWGMKNLREDLTRYRQLKKDGYKIILLPKTFGPFTDREQKQCIAELLETVDLWFARDSESRLALADAGVREVPVFPDYTTSLPPLHASEYEKFARRPIVIPNVRMLERTGQGNSIDYLKQLKSIFALLRERFGDPLILAHDLGRDCELVRQLARELDADFVIDPRPRIVKGIIGKAPVIYSDRLHGIINACSQSVPALASGWNHKYREILRDYNSEQFLIGGNGENAREMVREISENHAAITKNISDGAAKIREKNSAMWRLVSDVMNS